jgi:hypothetical protein
MAYLALADAFLAIVVALWLRALVRAREEQIPCTARIFSWAIVAVGVIAMVGLVVANVLVLQALDRAFGRTLSPILFTAWLLAMSAAAILFVVAIATLHTNRSAAAWIRLVPPSGLVVRVAGETATLALAPGSVRALGLVGGSAGVMYVQYAIRNGDRSIELVVPYTRDAGRATDGAPWLDGLSGLVAQGRARALHRYFAQFCAPDARGGA